jgi:phosphatidylserine/phosphatidylglycerophosphate/cardiolipin synthase-like enzyme
VAIPRWTAAAPEERAFSMTYLEGRALYEKVIEEGLVRAKRSVWIATANLKELWIAAGRRGRYISILELFGELCDRGVELRILHAELPSRRFRAAFDRRQGLVRGGLRLKLCPRVHLKTVIIDGESIYLGSANLTGAGLGAKGESRRNFEVGFLSSDGALIDAVSARFDTIWRGEECRGCGLIDVCPDPIVPLRRRQLAQGEKKARKGRRTASSAG